MPEIEPTASAEIASTNTRSTTLQYLHCDHITAGSVVQCCHGLLTSDESAFGLLYSSDKCRLIRMTSTELLAAQNSDIKLQNVFELRIFNEAFEFRWLHEHSSNGRAVIVSESKLAKPSIGDWIIEFVSDVESQAAHGYQLWGKALSESEADGWTILTDAQIGELRVPLSGLATDQRVALTALEYLGVADDDGNMIVVEERLTGLKAVDKVGREK